MSSNIASSNQCVHLGDPGAQNYEIDTCNIINNTQTTNSYGIITCAKETEIKNCCILNNEGGYLIYPFSSSIIITIVNCTLPSFYSITRNVITNDAKPDFPFINELNSTYCTIPSKIIQRTYRGPHIYRERKQIDIFF